MALGSLGVNPPPKPLADAELALRAMREGDIALMLEWLARPEVAAWYGGRDQSLDPARMRAKYMARLQGESEVCPCIIEVGARAVGYLQHYPVLRAQDYALDEAEGVHGVDLFIGEPRLWGAGLGTRVLRLLLAHLFDERGAQQIVMDPRVVNRRAIRCYEKAGFVKVKLLPRHERHEGELCDCWLMMAESAGPPLRRAL